MITQDTSPFNIQKSAQNGRDVKGCLPKASISDSKIMSSAAYGR